MLRFHLMRTMLAATVFVATIGFGPVRAADPVAADQAVLELDLPAGAKVLDNGQPIEKRKFTYQSLKPATMYTDEVRVQLADGGVVSRRIVFKAGWNVKLPVRPPDAQRPEVYLQDGHTGDSVRRAEFSRDGRYLLTANDTNIILWNAETGEPLRTFRHQTILNAMGFCADDRRIYSATQMEGFFIWDRETGRKLDAIKPERTLMSAAVTPDGRHAVLGLSGNFFDKEQSFLSFRDISTGQEVRRMRLTNREIKTNFDTPNASQVMVSANGKRIAAVIAFFNGGSGFRSYDDFAVVVFDSNGNPVREVRVPTLAILDAVLSPDGERLLLGLGAAFVGRESQWELWSLSDGQLLGRDKVAGAISGVSFTPDGKKFVETVSKPL